MNQKNATREQESSMCCGGPAPKDAEACCAQDAAAKSAGEAGCGCGQPNDAEQKRTVSCCG